MQRLESNAPRYHRGPKGHYESYFVRANHPVRARAFWLRYTVFAPAGRPADAVGELWAVMFDGDTGRHVATKAVVPIDDTHMSVNHRDGAGMLAVRIGSSVLIDHAERRTGELRGAAESGTHAVRWDLTYTGTEEPLTLLPDRLYAGGFPKAKALVPAPLVTFDGHLEVDGVRHDVTGWVGSQNHNWGARHTDEYAWGQVAGFDGDPGVFAEWSTARIRMGGLRTPWLTPVVIRLPDGELRHNGLRASARTAASYTYDGDTFRWTFRSHGRLGVYGEIEAPRTAFVGLRYDNPPGGSKTCLNTKIASCRLEIRRDGAPPVILTTAHRAAFEILTDRTDHGVPMLA